MRKTIGASESSSIYLLGICAGSVLSQLMFLALTNVKGGLGGMSTQHWVGYVIMQVAFIACVLIYTKVRKLDEITVAKVHKPRDFRQFILTPFIAIATILVFLPLANAWGAFLDVIGFHGSGVAMITEQNVGVYFLSLLVMAVLPAFGEEFLMRGNVFHGLSSRNIWFGILMSALFFSLMHANPVQTVHQFGLGVTLAITLALTGSIWSCVLVHFFNNFISITLTTYLPQVNDWYVKLGYFNWLTGAASMVVGLLLLVLLFFIMYKLGNKQRREYKVVANGVEYEEYTFTAILPEDTKTNPFKEFFAFFKSLFKKSGWIKITRILSNQNDVNYIGKSQPMFGVWIALALAIAYWLYAFIAGLV